MISGIITAVLLVSFVGIAAWAWSARQRERFDQAARLPLDDELPPCCRGGEEPQPPDNRTRGQA